MHPAAEDSKPNTELDPWGGHGAVSSYYAPSNMLSHRIIPRGTSRSLSLLVVLTPLRSDTDPILQYRPVFARSLPVQLLVNGIVLTLMSVLLLQLLFTAQYHFRLAPVNYAFQFAGVCMLLTDNIASLHVIMSTVSDESKTWPYMLNYLAVDLPPQTTRGWSTAEVMAWLFMMAASGLLIQATHIQFLGLLFPSKLEKRLIFWSLGPLAATSAAMQLIRIVQDAQVNRTATAVQNVCNATLSMLFTVSLAIWGLLVNRKNAWRMDGGTAAFGVGALILAPISTAISLVYIPSRFEFSWMKPLMWSVILWQSFFGWWNGREGSPHRSCALNGSLLRRLKGFVDRSAQHGKHSIFMRPRTHDLGPGPSRTRLQPPVVRSYRLGDKSMKTINTPPEMDGNSNTEEGRSWPG